MEIGFKDLPQPIGPVTGTAIGGFRYLVIKSETENRSMAERLRRLLNAFKNYSGRAYIVNSAYVYAATYVPPSRWRHHGEYSLSA